MKTAEIIKKISFASGLSEEDILQKIEEKRNVHTNLSSDGAAYLVAKDIGISLVEQQRLKLENVVIGMQNVDVIGKITRIFPVREFKTDKSQGKVANVILADETDSVRLSLWNEETDKLEGLEEGDVLRIRGYVKEDNMGQPEIRLGRHGSLAKSEEKLEGVAAKRSVDRATISELREGAYKEIRAPFVQVFESNIFYEVCPECKSRLKEDNDYKCEEHGTVEKEYGMVITGIIDDGTGNMRAVMFNEVAEKVLGMNRKEAKELFDRKKKISAVLESVPLGKEFLFTGRVRRNNFFDRTEFSVSDVKNVDVKKEIEILEGKLKETEGGG